jgi:prepilin-type N-terminal cleavage/methylation domain-containing protein
MKRRAFTLVELLVVIAIIAVLLAILMPSLTTVKAIARRLQCANGLSGLGKSYAIYIDSSNGMLPTLEYYKKSPTASADSPFTPSIESSYLLNKLPIGSNARPLMWRHMGCLYGAGLVDTGRPYYCPAVDGWRGEYDAQIVAGQNGSPPTWANEWGSFNQGAKATKGYTYWSLSKEMATQNHLDGMNSTARTRYRLGLPISATRISELLMTRPIAVDHTFHSTKSTGWMMNALYPDTHVQQQMQPKKDGLGMYSEAENNQFPGDVYGGGVFRDPAEAAKNLPNPVSSTEFAFALQP